MEHDAVGLAVLDALHYHEDLRDLDHSDITVVPTEALRLSLESLAELLRSLYGDRFTRRTFGIQVEQRTWRAGLTFLPEPASIPAFDWPRRGASTVRVFAGSGRILQFMKREDGEGEHRISFGDPTRAIDAALAEYLGHIVETTSRSARTVRGVLNLAPA